MNSPIRPIPPIESLPEGVSRRLWTADDLLAMVRAGIIAENDRVELIGGEIVAMAAKGIRHENIRNELVLYWARRLPADVKFATETPLRLASTEEPEPDIILHSANSRATQVDGDSVLLVVEISNSSLSYDLKLKAPRYAAFGVREYWVIDAANFDTYVHRQPGPDGYGDVQHKASSDLLTPLAAPALAVRLADLDIE